jgi:predicted RNA-binding Zn-ribbon protein involved in translation (DUF1610 family)
MSNKQKSILYRTDQAWKYNTSLAVGSFAVLIAVGAFYFYSYQSWQFELCIALAVALSIAKFSIAFRIKCPKCGSRWYWQALKTSVSDNGLGKLRSQEACPACGYSGSAGT